MALTPPLFQQNREYSARVTRQFLDLIGTEGVVEADGFEVTERQAGAAMAVEVKPGRAFITGDDQAFQGNYLVANEAVVELPVEGADPADARIDRVVLQVRDPNAGGPAGDDVVFTILTGTPAAVPVAPTLPDTAISLATIEVEAAVSSIFDADITDTRAFAANPLAPPPALDDLTDVDASTPGDGDLLQYESGSGSWQSVPGELDRLTDVELTAPEDGEVLTYDGAQWVNQQPPAPFRALFFLMGA